MSKDTSLPIGTKTVTMLSGFDVPIEILEAGTSEGLKPFEQWLGVVYKVRYLGTRKCLDFGQDWWIENGFEFHTRQVNIDRAVALNGGIV